jgi:RNA polymerase sigma-70 factor (ECF subfamily)
MTDAELVEQALAGSQDAFRELVVRFERPVYGLVARMVRDPAAAEDLAQEVFVKAFRRLDTYDPRRKFASWLFKVAHNTTIDHLRRSAPETLPLETREDGGGIVTVLADSSAERPDAAAERHAMARSLERAIARLRPDYREVVILRYVEGLSYQEIGESTELPIGTVKTHLHRARKELAETMTALGWAPPAAGDPGDAGQPGETGEESGS